jgi:hypothetical protein
MEQSNSTINAAESRLAESRTELLQRAWEANQQGDRQHAYELSLQATQNSPEDIRAWVLRARTAPSLEEKIVCLNQINRLNPHDPYAQLETYESLKLLLEKDPFLAYLDQSDDLYQVHNGVNMMLAVPKDRAVPDPHPAPRPRPIKAGSRWLWLALLGLFSAGVATLIFAPLAAIKALQLDYRSLSYSDRMRGYVQLGLAILLCLLAIPLVGVLLLHIF